MGLSLNNLNLLFPKSLFFFFNLFCQISDYTWVDSIADRESKTKYHSRSKARVARPR